MGETTVV